MRQKVTVAAAVIAAVLLGGTAYATDPNPLEDAYWRFEEGPAGTKVPPGNNTITDVTVNSNHMRRYDPAGDPIPDYHAPTYVADVPGPIVPGTGEANNLALYFDGPFGSTPPGGVDIYTDVKNINNPIVTAFTVEASFKADAVGAGLWQAVVCREANTNDTSRDEPLFILKITGDGNNRLRMELRDKGNNVRLIDSQAVIAAGQWYHAAVVATSTEVKAHAEVSANRSPTKNPQ